MAVLLNLGRTLSKTLAKMSVIRETIVQSTKATISDFADQISQPVLADRFENSFVRYGVRTRRHAEE
jgi:hypothetical protein